MYNNYYNNLSLYYSYFNFDYINFSSDSDNQDIQLFNNRKVIDNTEAELFSASKVDQSL